MEKIIIVGAGPAGISAALYAARGNMDPLVIHHGSSSLEKAEKIENFYGLERPLSGKELYERGISQAKALGVRIMDAQVLGVGGLDTFQVRTTAGTLEGESVILSTGGKRGAPAIPGLHQLEGRGVSYCAVCDAFFYRGKQVAVLGSGDFALHEAGELVNLCSKVTICTNGKEPEFSTSHDFPVDTREIEAILGDSQVSGIRFKDGETLEASGVFVALGVAGSSEIARQMGAELTEKGQIKTDGKMATTIPGLFAAGDCTGGLLQVSAAVYEGSQAGLSAIAYVRRRHAGGKEK